MRITNKILSRLDIESKYICGLDCCIREFESKKQLYDHQFNVHKRKSTYRYTHCAASFPTPSKLSRHCRVHNAIKCTIEGCGVELQNYKEKLKHMAKQHAQLDCDQCVKRFSSKSELRKHLRFVHPKMISCTVVDCKKSILPQNLSRHIKDCHQSMVKSDPLKHIDPICTFSCPYCPRQLAKAHLLNKHLKCAHSEKRFIRTKKFKCDVGSCDRSFLSLIKLESHKNWHLNLKPYKCPENSCLASFCSKLSLQRHVRSVHLKRLDDYSIEQLNGGISSCVFDNDEGNGVRLQELEGIHSN